MSGDLAWRDTDGYYWFVARKKDIIRKRGENISGAELDRVIGKHPAVLEAAAIPVPAESGRRRNSGRCGTARRPERDRAGHR